jgi:hypothetical protein
VQEKAEDGQLVYRLDPYVSAALLGQLYNGQLSILKPTSYYFWFTGPSMSLSPMMANGRQTLQYLDMQSGILLQQRFVL